MIQRVLSAILGLIIITLPACQQNQSIHTLLLHPKQLIKQYEYCTAHPLTDAVTQARCRIVLQAGNQLRLMLMTASTQGLAFGRQLLAHQSECVQLQHTIKKTQDELLRLKKRTDASTQKISDLQEKGDALAKQQHALKFKINAMRAVIRLLNPIET